MTEAAPILISPVISMSEEKPRSKIRRITGAVCSSGPGGACPPSPCGSRRAGRRSTGRSPACCTAHPLPSGSCPGGRSRFQGISCSDRPWSGLWIPLNVNIPASFHLLFQIPLLLSGKNSAPSMPDRVSHCLCIEGALQCPRRLFGISLLQRGHITLWLGTS